jgi:hypothetical protein
MDSPRLRGNDERKVEFFRTLLGLLMIAAGYEEGNDATGLRLKMVLDQAPPGGSLCPQSTISRLENLPGKRALPRPAKRPKGGEIRAIRRRLLPAWTGREPHQVLEDPPGRRPHVVP